MSIIVEIWVILKVTETQKPMFYNQKGPHFSTKDLHFSKKKHKLSHFSNGITFCTENDMLFISYTKQQINNHLSIFNSYYEGQIFFLKKLHLLE